MSLEDDLKHYYKGIRKHLFCSRKSQTDFMAEARRLVADFLENQPDATFDDIVINVGKPEELAETFLNTLPDKTEVERFRKVRRRQRRLAVALLTLAIIVLVGVIVYISWVRRATVISEGTVTIIRQETDAPSSMAASSKN
ncbi:hypothetical protein [Caproicibacter fermentans]|uniref:DUF1700 domain-containing protein n=1 Tax=Caproicibacter fermentans TaxID=2576756 RepID=A0A7G8T6J2_9FIRM|nr:hypothetical protein [Caproicibacter fermentans]QNK39233.1 hypothetical protein HCR03_10655 [Caproicibacter fermentans]